MTTKLANETLVDVAMAIYRTLTDEDRRGMLPVLRGMALASPRRPLLSLVVVNDSKATRSRRACRDFDQPGASFIRHPVAPENRRFALVNAIDEN